MEYQNSADNYAIYVDSFVLALKVEGITPHTRSCYARDVLRLGERSGWISPVKINATHIRNYIDWLSGRVKPSTAKIAQLALRRFFKYLLAEQEIETDPTAKIKLPRVRATPQPTYNINEIYQILGACDQTTWNGVRNKAIVTVLFDTGVRVGDLVSMEIPDWANRTVEVNGKTGHRVVPLGETTIIQIHRYARRWGITEGKLWKGERGAIQTSGVFQMIRRICRKADVEFKGVHAFRRTAAAQMKRLGMNDSDILEVMGWKDITMLRHYTAAVATELAQAAHVRYSPTDAL